MKRIFVLWCAAALFAVACEKENPTPAQENPMNPSDTTQTDTTQTDTIPIYPPTADVIYNAVTDYDGNSYDAVRIGNQVWMASNLRTTHYANGEDIPDGGENTSESESDTEPYRYQPSTTDILSYGYLYSWPAVMHGASSSSANPSGVQGVCPNGWHVPSDAEWTELTDYCSSHMECVCSGDGNNIAKALAANHDWPISENECAVGNDLSANNVTGFSALPAGYYDQDDYSSFGFGAVFWCATEGDSSFAYYRSFGFTSAKVSHSYNCHKYVGCSVRCVRD